MGADRQDVSSRRRRLRVFGGPVLEASPLAANGERTAHPAGCRVEVDERMYQADDQFTARKARRPSRAVVRVRMRRLRAVGPDIGDQVEISRLPEIGLVRAHLPRVELTADRDIGADRPGRWPQLQLGQPRRTRRRGPSAGRRDRRGHTSLAHRSRGRCTRRQRRTRTPCGQHQRRTDTETSDQPLPHDPSRQRVQRAPISLDAERCSRVAADSCPRTGFAGKACAQPPAVCQPERTLRRMPAKASGSPP